MSDEKKESKEDRRQRKEQKRRDREAREMSTPTRKERTKSEFGEREKRSAKKDVVKDTPVKKENFQEFMFANDDGRFPLSTRDQSMRPYQRQLMHGRGEGKKRKEKRNVKEKETEHD